MTGRIRFRITAVQPDRNRYFARLTAILSDHLGYGFIRANPVTGTVLLADPALDMDAVAAIGRSENLFMLTPAPPVSPIPAIRHVRTQVNKIDGFFRTLTANQLDLSGSVFLVLVIHAIREIVQGNLTAPSWFTALWVASSLYNKDFTGQGVDGGVHEGGTGDADAH